MESTKYASVRVKAETYREMKQVALDAGIPFTRLMDEMLMAYKESQAQTKAGTAICTRIFKEIK